MSDALLADDPTQTTDATTTQGEAAIVDTQPSSEQPTQTETETPTETTEDKAAEPKTEEPAGAPESYEQFSVPEGMPEGFELDKAVSDAIGDVSRDLGLPQDKAQQLINGVLPAWQAHQVEQETKLHDKWTAETKADEDIGGQKLDENLGLAKQAVKAYGNEDLQTLLDGPLGSHPEVVRFLVKVGKDVSEDKFVGGKTGAESVDLNDETAVAKAMYPNTPS